MNKTKVTTRKGSKTKTKKESPEVFVLPPNLLEKLGINLGNYGSPTGSISNSQITDLNVTPKESGHCENKLSLKENFDSHAPTSVIQSSSEIKSTSIIETAELMKRSVFLSPTFISNNTSVIQGEIEIVGNVVEESTEVVSVGFVNDENIIEKTGEGSIDMHREHVSLSNVQKMSPNSSNTQENRQCDQIFNGNIKMHDLEMQTLIDDHADEAYSSDCSSSNIGCSVKHDLSKSNVNKINIISEEIIYPSRLYKLKNNYLPKENSFIHVPINTTIKSHNIYSVRQDDLTLDLIPNEIGSVEQAEMARVNECDIFEENFRKEDDVSKADFEMLQNLNKIDLCTVLNTTQSEFIMTTQNEVDPRQNLEALPIPHKQEVILEDQVAIDTAVIVPCQIDFVFESNLMLERGNIGAQRNTCSEHGDNAVKEESFEVNASFSTKHKNKEVILTNAISNEDKSDMLLDKNNVTPHVIEAVNEIQISPGNQYSLMKACSQSENTASDRDTCQDALESRKDANISENNVVELLSTLQNGEADLTNPDQNISLTGDRDDGQVSFRNSVTNNVMKSEGKCRRSKSTRKTTDENKASNRIETSLISKHMQDENNSVQETSTGSPIVYFKHYKKQVCEQNELLENRNEQKNSKNTPDACKDAGSRESNNLELHHVNKAAVHDDKIREIAKYLSVFAELKKRNHFMERNKTVGGNAVSNKKNITYSKSSIQGVEKPGGSGITKIIQNYLPTKTYERRGRQGCKNITLSTFKGSSTSTHSIDLPDRTINICNEIEVCLCHDFGRLMSYDDVNSYEHIHFWNSARMECTPDLIFSIYSEDAAPVTIDDDIKDYPIDVCDDVPYRLCWNEIKPINKKETENNVTSRVYIENIRKNDNKKQEAEKEHMVENTMLTVNILQNCEGITNDKDEPSKTGQKRKPSSLVTPDNDGPPAKNKKQGTPKQLLETKETCAYIEEQHTSTKFVKNIPVKISPLKDSSCGSTTLFATDGEHHTGACIPANDTRTEHFDSPSTSINEVKIHCRSKTQLSTENNKPIICGVCQLSVEGDWIQHISSKHDYRAWKSGEPSLDVHDEVAVREHLSEITKTGCGLTCGKCGLTRKYVKAYLSHVRRCSGSKADCSSELRSSEELVESRVKIKEQPADDRAGQVICGVCEESMQDSEWNEHRSSRHDYLAWKCGELPVDVQDEAAVKAHLYEITKACGGLTCAKCGLTRKYVKAYLSHVRNCTGLSESQNDSAYNASSEVMPKVESSSITEVTDENVADTNAGPIKCGVCEESVQTEDWNHHIGSHHNYLAWEHGNMPLDIYDEEAVRNHLYEITKARGGLTCSKCGLTRKYVKAYMSHIKNCNGLNESQNDSTYNVLFDEMNLAEKSSDTKIATKVANANALVKCAVCEESVREKDWISHIASQHDYLAWKVGDTALDIYDEEAVRNHLYEITKACGGLTCSKCGLTRKYVKAYLTHFKTCSGVDESQNTSVCNTSTEKSGVDLVDFANSSTSNNKAHESLVKCGVCSQDVQESEWNNHISFLHNYLAWKCGEESLDVADEEEVRKHLVCIKKETGALTCAKCCKNIKTVKKYMRHVESCGGISSSDLKDSSLDLVVERQVQALTTPADSALVKCGVCGQYSPHDDWTQHMAASHGYLAWKDGEPPLNLNDEEEVRVHLRTIIIEIGTLTCQKCDLPCKSVKSYLHHVKKCEGIEKEVNENKSAVPKIEKANTFKCGVCNDVVISLLWAKHLSEMHDYLAWKEGDAPLNVDDDEEVHQHLSNFSKEFGSLYCKYCGKNRKYAKSFLEHIKACKIGGIRDRAPAAVVDFDDVDFASGGTCAVCEKEVEAGKWIQHTQKEHNYLAWRKGERAWNLDDFEDVNQYLYVICKRMDGLTCNKCGLVRKYVKTYLTHIKNCDVIDTSVAEGIGPSNKDENQCAMCKEVVKSKDWKTHAIENHYNVTWIVGETPIDIKNVYAVERFLKEYKQIKGNLKCNACGTTRASFAGFYAHIIICRKTEEEIDMYRSVCNICNNKYLCIYKNQHAMIHRVQSLTAEAKIKPNEEKKEINLTGKRRAAVKARSVIENYSDNMSKHSHSCKSCGFGTDVKEELRKHKCEVSNEKDFSGDEDSAAEIGSSEDESEDTDVDSNISNEVNYCGRDDDDDDDDHELQAKKKRYRDPAPVLSKVTRIPFKVDDVNSYIRNGDEDFCKTYLTDEVLFPRWQCQHEPVLEPELTRYMPPLEHSCKFKTDSAWTTLKRFQALENDRGTSIFVGASIVCIAWVPPRVEDMSDGASNFLAIACHNGPDCPRYQGGETPKHENLIQIWTFNKFRGLPEIVLGIAHDFGTVWSMDWCPSGARDALTAENAASRLGLLAVACSSGSVYIFAVPYPSTVVKNNQIVQKLKPVAELRMTMGSNRKPYQATSVSWSKQKEHNLVLVGYADGSTAYYDLHTDSPLLSAVENNVQVFHPYYDERPHNTCITGTDLYPVSDDAAGSGSGVWTAPTGAELAARAGTGAPGRARLATASHGVTFAPQACTAVIAGDDAIMQASVSELVWVPPGRRLGGTRCAAGCARCGRVVASMPPTLRIMRMHPSFCDAKKQVIGMLEMTHLAMKRKKKVNDDLSMTIEPLTYGDAVSKYGIAFTRIAKSDRVMQQQCSAKPKAHCPERFPLADVESMSFCPSKKFHDKLAIATHSGILFLITTN